MRSNLAVGFISSCEESSTQYNYFVHLACKGRVPFHGLRKNTHNRLASGMAWKKQIPKAIKAMNKVGNTWLSSLTYKGHVIQLVQPHDYAGIGELALDPTLFGSSTTLLNVDHHQAYFSGMPKWNGKIEKYS